MRPKFLGAGQPSARSRESVQTKGRFLANQPRWNSLRARNEPGAHAGQSQELTYTIDRLCGAALAKCFSVPVRQSN